MKPSKPTPILNHEGIQREILYFSGIQSLLQELDQLQQPACWHNVPDGVMATLQTFPIYEHSLFVWEMFPANHFLWIRQGNNGQPPARETSIDPYSFLLTHSPN